MHSTHLALSNTLAGFCSLLQTLNCVVTVMYTVPVCSIWGGCAAIRIQQTAIHCICQTQQTVHMLLCGVQALLDDNTFCGLALDEDNQDDLSADRVQKWVAQISKEMKA